MRAAKQSSIEEVEVSEIEPDMLYEHLGRVVTFLVLAGISLTALWFFVHWAAQQGPSPWTPMVYCQRASDGVFWQCRPDIPPWADDAFPTKEPRK